MKNWKIILPVVLVLLVIVIFAIASNKKNQQGRQKQNGDLASCLKNKGVKFYGTSSCPYCNKQKEMFGVSSSNLPYVECSNNPECSNLNLTGYPTWIFPDGKRLVGQRSLDELKQHAGC